MNNQQTTHTLFDENERHNAKPAGHMQTRFDFYNDSSVDVATSIRAMLQRWLDRMPPQKQKDLVAAMHKTKGGATKADERFLSAFFELFLHEFLSGTGGDIEVEPTIGSRPDFRVSETGKDGHIVQFVLEATCISLLAGDNPDEMAVIDKLNEINSRDFYLLVDTEGVLTSTPPLKKVKKVFQELVKCTNYDMVRTELQRRGESYLPIRTFTHDEWKLTGRLHPVRQASRPNKGKFVGLEALREEAELARDSQRVKKTLEGKAKQHKRVDNVIVAIRTHDERQPFDMDEALFGPGGFWGNTMMPKHEHVIGAVVFDTLFAHCVGKARAVFYANPYVQKPLPSWANEITHAEYSGGKIEIVKGVQPCNFLKDYETFEASNFRFEQ